MRTVRVSLRVPVELHERIVAFHADVLTKPRIHDPTLSEVYVHVLKEGDHALNPHRGLAETIGRILDTQVAAMPADTTRAAGEARSGYTESLNTPGTVTQGYRDIKGGAR